MLLLVKFFVVHMRSYVHNDGTHTGWGGDGIGMGDIIVGTRRSWGGGGVGARQPCSRAVDPVVSLQSN